MELNKENFDAIIIGSGIGGLVTASQLAAKGAYVHLLSVFVHAGDAVSRSQLLGVDTRQRPRVHARVTLSFDVDGARPIRERRAAGVNLAFFLNGRDRDDVEDGAR